MNYLGKRIREIRESKGLLLRQVAAALEVDTALISKIELGERKAQRAQVTKIAKFLEVSKDELIILWLSDKMSEVIINEPLGNKALNFIMKEKKKENDL